MLIGRSTDTDDNIFKSKFGRYYHKILKCIKFLYVITYHIIILFFLICFNLFELDAEMRFYSDKSNRSDGDKIVAAVQIVDQATGKVVMIAPDVGLRYSMYTLHQFSNLNL